MYSYVINLQCPKCNKTYEKQREQHLCVCESPLLVQYDLDRVKKEWSKEQLLQEPLSLWRYHPLLPVEHPSQVVTMGEGMTPLLPMEQYGAEIGLSRLLMKDDGSFQLVRLKQEVRQLAFQWQKRST
ncbi:threonine synthase [Bacillus sp. JCM 19046]|nr:threonine synthase [Bacillus sp. JCM 19046]